MSIAADIARAERRATVLRLKNAGVSYSAISEQVGVSVQTCVNDVRAGLQEILREPAEEMIANQKAITRDLIRAMYPAAMRGDADAAKTILKTLEHQAKLFGMYAPQRIHISGSDEEFARMTAALMTEIGLEPPEVISAAARKAIGERPVIEGEVLAEQGVPDGLADADEEGPDDEWVS